VRYVAAREGLIQSVDATLPLNGLVPDRWVVTQGIDGVASGRREQRERQDGNDEQHEDALKRSGDYQFEHASERFLSRIILEKTTAV
jgi:hypothetical protein